MRTHRHAFTLVELLVVIGIIALLISILLPALNRARDSAKTVVCASNLRQLHLARELYTGMWNGYTLPAAAGHGSATRYRWWGTDIIGAVWGLNDSGSIADIVRNYQYLQCPSIQRDVDLNAILTGAGGINWWGGYTFSSHMGDIRAHDGTYVAKEFIFKRHAQIPGNVIVALDARDPTLSKDDDRFFRAQDLLILPTQRAGAPHREKTNILLHDGQVRYVDLRGLFLENQSTFLQDLDNFIRADKNDGIFHNARGQNLPF